jgi:hypothetical protein
MTLEISQKSALLSTDLSEIGLRSGQAIARDDRLLFLPRMPINKQLEFPMIYNGSGRICLTFFLQPSYSSLTMEITEGVIMTPEIGVKPARLLTVAAGPRNRKESL